jgi:hypothetical protein
VRKDVRLRIYFSKPEGILPQGKSFENTDLGDYLQAMVLFLEHNKGLFALISIRNDSFVSADAKIYSTRNNGSFQWQSEKCNQRDNQCT